MKRDILRLSLHQSVETGRDHNGRYFIAYSSGASVFCREAAELRRFLKLPRTIPMREALESWLASLSDQDVKRVPPPAAATSELLATGFGPECHLDESDPNHATRTII